MLAHDDHEFVIVKDYVDGVMGRFAPPPTLIGARRALADLLDVLVIGVRAGLINDHAMWDDNALVGVDGRWTVIEDCCARSGVWKDGELHSALLLRVLELHHQREAPCPANQTPPRQPSNRTHSWWRPYRMAAVAAIDPDLAEALERNAASVEDMRHAIEDLAPAKTTSSAP
jgi:hypothetical protein